MSLRSQTAVRLFLVVAGVHQLGACACGHAEHNGWVQAVRGVLSDSEAPGEPSSGFSSLAQSHDDDRHEHDPAALSATMRVVDLLSEARDAATLRPAPIPLENAAWSEDSCCVAISALPVRARLQVFRL